jgi:hypothetical protein
MSSEEKIARNFIKARGRTMFRLLLTLLERQESGQEIGKAIGVSRERVRQWKDAFGQTVCHYSIHPDVRRLAAQRQS